MGRCFKVLSKQCYGKLSRPTAKTGKPNTRHAALILSEERHVTWMVHDVAYVLI